MVAFGSRAAVPLISGVLLLTPLACLNDGHAPDPPPTRQRSCTPASEGYEGTTALQAPTFSLPAGCRILEDDGRVAIFRRQVVEVTDSAALAELCRQSESIPDAGLSPFDGGANAPMIDFGAWRLLVVRIPDTTLPSWVVSRADEVILGESSAICTGIDPKPRRYLQLVPRTATITFHLCEPEGCEEEG